MDRKATLIIAGAVALGTLATGAVAQETRPQVTSLRVGAFFPGNGDVRDLFKTGFAAGVEYRFQDLRINATNPAYTAGLSLSVDYMGGNDFSSVPVLVNYVGRTNQFFYSAGAGLSFIRFDGDGTDFNRTRFGYQIGVGFDLNTTLTNPVFVEAKYFGSSESRANGFGVYLGVRF